MSLKDGLSNIAKEIGESIMNATPEEINEELTDLGLDPDEEAQLVRAIINNAIPLPEECDNDKCGYPVMCGMGHKHCVRHESSNA